MTNYFVLITLSPFIVLLFAYILVIIKRSLNLPKPRTKHLIRSSYIYAGMGAGFIFIIILVALLFYEILTGSGTDGRQAMLWIICCIAVGAAIGQLIALYRWWFDNSDKKLKRKSVLKPS